MVVIEIMVCVKFHSSKMPFTKLHGVTSRQTDVGSDVNGGEW